MKRIERKLFLSDSENEINNDIELYISKTGKIIHNIDSELPEEKSICLYDYVGKIGIPKNTALKLVSYSGNIKGVIDSPAEIIGYNVDIHLVIPNNSDLKICSFVEEGDLTIDGKYIQKSKKGKTRYGINFKELRQNYKKDKFRREKKPEIIYKSDRIYADFGNIKHFDIRNLNICIKFGIIYISNFKGNVNIYYADTPYESTPNKFDNHFKKGITKSNTNLSLEEQLKIQQKMALENISESLDNCVQLQEAIKKESRFLLNPPKER